MKIIFRIILWLLVIVVIIFLIGFLLPSSVYVERRTVVNATPHAVYTLANDLKTYDKWMPWNQLDPNWKVQYGNQSVGEGAWYQWHSEKREVGNGKLTITESVPDKKVTTKLEFAGYDPALGGWQFQPSGNGTEVKWFMNSSLGNNPFSRWMGLFMDKMVGPQFEQGLGNLKKLAEQNPAAL